MHIVLTGSCRLKLMSNVSFLQNHNDYMTLDKTPPMIHFIFRHHRGVPPMQHAVFSFINNRFPSTPHAPVYTSHCVCPHFLFAVSSCPLGWGSPSRSEHSLCHLLNKIELYFRVMACRTPQTEQLYCL